MNARDYFHGGEGPLGIVQACLGSRSSKVNAPTPLVQALDAQLDGPYMYYCLPENIALVSILLDYGADISATGFEGRTPLQLAASTGKCDSIEVIISRRRAQIRTADLNSALLLAIGLYKTKAASLLLEAGADANAKTAYGWSALMNATDMNQPTVVSLLLKRGADVRYLGTDGQTALSLAMKYHLDKEIRLITEAAK